MRLAAGYRTSHHDLQLVRRLAILEEQTMKIGSIVIRCYEFDRMLAFWQEALHYVPREPVDGGWVVLCDPGGRGPNMSL
jgi:hypothetical protein